MPTSLNLFQVSHAHLCEPVPGLLGTAASTVSLHHKDLRFCVVVACTVCDCTKDGSLMRTCDGSLMCTHVHVCDCTKDGCMCLHQRRLAHV